MTAVPFRLSPSAPSVLVVDDEPAMCNALRMMLELEGYGVCLASSGRRALAQVADRLPRVVLLDLQMPGMDGGEALDALKARAPALPVVLVSGARQVHQTEAAHHADGVLLKPFDVDGVLATVARFIPSPAP